MRVAKVEQQIRVAALDSNRVVEVVHIGAQAGGLSPAASGAGADEGQLIQRRIEAASCRGPAADAPQDRAAGAHFGRPPVEFRAPLLIHHVDQAAHRIGGIRDRDADGVDLAEQFLRRGRALAGLVVVEPRVVEAAVLKEPAVPVVGRVADDLLNPLRQGAHNVAGLDQAGNSRVDGVRHCLEGGGRISCGLG